MLNTGLHWVLILQCWKVKKAASLKTKGLLYSCLLIANLPSRSQTNYVNHLFSIWRPCPVVYHKHKSCIVERGLSTLHETSYLESFIWDTAVSSYRMRLHTLMESVKTDFPCACEHDMVDTEFFLSFLNVVLQTQKVCCGRLGTWVKQAIFIRLSCRCALIWPWKQTFLVLAMFSNIHTVREHGMLDIEGVLLLTTHGRLWCTILTWNKSSIFSLEHRQCFTFFLIDDCVITD